jgi:hypothetical protein
MVPRRALMATIQDLEPPAAEPALDDLQPPAEPDDRVWKLDKKGREYVRGEGATRAPVYRRGEETPEQALARVRADRDASEQYAEDRAQPKPGTRKRVEQKPPPAPKRVEMREIEKALAEAFSSPAMLAATFGDEWGANHFTAQGPILARNICVTAERNPWLRRKLEDWVAGGDAAMFLISSLGVAVALVGYALPPIVYYLNLPLAPQARAMLNIPPRRPPAPPADARRPQTAAYPAAA